MSLIKNPPLYTDTDRSDVQKYFVASFLSPKDEYKCSLIKNINSILNDKINKRVRDITDSIKNELLEEFSKKNKSYIDTNSCVKIDLSEFNFKSREYNYSDDELLFEFETYKTDNDKDLKESYKTLYGRETCERGFKVRCVLNENRIVPTFKERATTKFCFPIGVWIPWHSPSINNEPYVFKESFITDLEGIMNCHLEYIRNDTKEFNERLEKK